MPRLALPGIFRAHPTETWLVIVLLVISTGLSLLAATSSSPSPICSTC